MPTEDEPPVATPEEKRPVVTPVPRPYVGVLTPEEVDAYVARCVKVHEIRWSIR